MNDLPASHPDCCHCLARIAMFCDDGGPEISPERYRFEGGRFVRFIPDQSPRLPNPEWQTPTPQIHERKQR